MGQLLSEPVTEKHTTSARSSRLSYGASAMQGWRMSMEDAHTTILQFEGKKETSFFAVFDGHGGSAVARFAGQATHHRVVNDPEFEAKNYAAALKNGFLGTDIDLRKDPEHSHEPSGCTAVAVLITEDNRIFCANAGDSRSVLSSKGKAVPLSFDHKPTNNTEFERIHRAGGFVQFGRVNGNLALSRAIGDFEFKQNANLRAEEQVVTVDPDIIEHKIGPDDEFIVLACDGIWDCLSNQEVVSFVRERIAANRPLGLICEDLMEKCLAPQSHAVGVGCDNMTVVIVGLLMGEEESALVAKCSRPAELTDEVFSGSSNGSQQSGLTISSRVSQQAKTYHKQFDSELEEYAANAAEHQRQWEYYESKSESEKQDESH